MARYGPNNIDSPNKARFSSRTNRPREVSFVSAAIRCIRFHPQFILSRGESTVPGQVKQLPGEDELRIKADEADFRGLIFSLSRARLYPHEAIVIAGKGVPFPSSISTSKTTIDPRMAILVDPANAKRAPTSEQLLVNAHCLRKDHISFLKEFRWYFRQPNAVSDPELAPKFPCCFHDKIQKNQSGAESPHSKFRERSTLRRPKDWPRGVSFLSATIRCIRNHPQFVPCCRELTVPGEVKRLPGEEKLRMEADEPDFRGSISINARSAPTIVYVISMWDSLCIEWFTPTCRTGGPIRPG